MPTPRQRAWQALEQARRALRRGNRAAARAWARRAARYDPTWDAPWLILGLLSPAPRARRAYLQAALQRNPSNTLAARRLAALSSSAAPTTAPKATPPRRRIRQPTRPRRSYRAVLPSLFLVLVWGAVALLLLAGAWAFWPAKGAQALSSSATATRQAYSGPPTATVLRPTGSPTPTPRPTATSTATPTPLPTLTPRPSATASPTPSPTVPPTATATPIWPLPPGVQPDERWILVDLSEQRLYALRGTRIVRVFEVSTGVPQHPTVQGIFRIWAKYRVTDMSGPGYYLPQVPYTMYFYQGYGIHGTYWHNNFGQPMSHGCVNMRTEEAQWLFQWASIGTVVQVIP